MDLKSGLPLSLIKNGLTNNYPTLKNELKSEMPINKFAASFSFDNSNCFDAG